MLILPARVRETLVEHAREGAPEEVCGVLGGRREGGEAVRVETGNRVPNVAGHPRTEYRLDPEAQLRTIEELEAEGQEVVGFYHSHPAGPSRPSATDEARATWPGYVYLIVSFGDADGGPTIRAWRWTGERFAELAVRMVG